MNTFDSFQVVNEAKLLVGFYRALLQYPIDCAKRWPLNERCLEGISKYIVTTEKLFGNALKDYMTPYGPEYMISKMVEDFIKSHVFKFQPFDVDLMGGEKEINLRQKLMIHELMHKVYE